MNRVANEQSGEATEAIYEKRVPTVFITGVFQLFAFLLLFISLLYRQQELVLLALLVLIMFGGSKLWCWLSLQRVNCQLSPINDRSFPGETVTLKGEVTNEKLLPVWLQLRIHIYGHLLFASGKNIITEECSLPWYGRSSWQWKLTAKRRGCFQLGPPEIEAGDLFGFYQRQKSSSEASQVMIYPRLISLNHYYLPLKELFGKAGLKSPIADPVYPVATRDYVEGSPARHIHWKASARQNRLQEKVFEPSSQKKTLMLLDVESFYSSGEEEGFERTLEVVAAMAFEFDREGSPFGIITNGSLVGGQDADLPVAGGPQQISAALEMLARLQMVPVQEIKELLMQKIKSASGLGCIYFSAMQERNYTTAVELFKYFSIPTIYVLHKVSDLTLSDGHKIYLLEELHGENIDYSAAEKERILQEG